MTLTAATYTAAARTEVDLAAAVVARHDGSDGVVVLTLRAADDGPLPGWEPGAHVDLLLGADLVRSYSLCGDPADTHLWRLGILRETDGRGGSAHVHAHLTAGSTVRVRGPRNHFPLLDAAGYLFVAGGIGITPLLPMIAAADSAGADWRLVYGGRTRASMAFLDELSRYGDRVTVAPQDETGLLDLDALLGRPRPDTLVYCCGPEPLLAAVEERCPPGTLRVERFAPKPVTGGTDVFTVELARSGLTLDVPADRSVLDVAEEAGVGVLSSCSEGTCGTCETAVLDGVPDHRDSVLTPEEQAVGDCMMICVSRACGSRLVLDL